MIDKDDRLVGVITADDIVEVVQEEASEDILAMGGVGVATGSRYAAFNNPALLTTVLSFLPVFTLTAAEDELRQLSFGYSDIGSLFLNGRILYTRWEYSDSPHYFTRILFHMNPDGTEQMEYAFSNSYWPNSTFYARPVPNHPTKVVGIVTGHHGVARMGELVVFDPGMDRHEASGVVQRIPGYGRQVDPTIKDQLVNDSWPKFLHPYPLSDKYLLVSCQPGPQASWGIYLADVFDNLVLIREEPGYALLEPVPLAPRPRPPGAAPARPHPAARPAAGAARGAPPHLPGSGPRRCTG